MQTTSAFFDFDKTLLMVESTMAFIEMPHNI